LACHLLSIPASSASIERIFSNFSFIHTKLRNRLGVQRATKLVFCYRMLRGTHDMDYWLWHSRNNVKTIKRWIIWITLHYRMCQTTRLLVY
jgi:hypothetical protein